MTSSNFQTTKRVTLCPLKSQYLRTNSPDFHVSPHIISLQNLLRESDKENKSFLGDHLSTCHNLFS